MTNKRLFSPFLILFSFILLALAISIVSISLGAVAIPFDVIINTLFNLEGIQQKFVIINYRMPRVVLAWCVGLGIGVAGTIIQQVIRNPLASPKILGINSGAGFMAVLVTMVLPSISAFWIPLWACLGGVAVGALVYLLSWKQGTSPLRIALIGIAVASVFDSGVDFMIFHGGHELTAPMAWLSGSLWGRSWVHVYAILPFLPLVLIIWVLSYRVEILALGDEVASALGLSVEKLRLLLLSISVLLSSASVGVSGVLGFVGLITPQIALRLVGGHVRWLIPISGIVGINLILLADVVGRLIAPPIEVPAGVMIALFGAPYFIVLLTQQHEKQNA